MKKLYSFIFKCSRTNCRSKDHPRGWQVLNPSYRILPMCAEHSWNVHCEKVASWHKCTIPLTIALVNYCDTTLQGNGRSRKNSNVGHKTAAVSWSWEKVQQSRDIFNHGPLAEAFPVCCLEDPVGAGWLLHAWQEAFIPAANNYYVLGAAVHAWVYCNAFLALVGINLYKKEFHIRI